MQNKKYETVIGLEIHVRLDTKSKMFCACSNSGEDLPPNTTVCPICMGHPGTLPAMNEQAIAWGMKAALAINCTVAHESKFDRKHYFYPDLPKGYQISQYDQPIGQNGWIEFMVESELKKVRLNRLHLEEDAAKLMHEKNHSLVDFNRAGVPLAEIVTEVDLRSPKEAKAFLQELRRIMRYLGVSEADMEKGHLRCDANISLRPVGDAKLYAKTEIKNLNSFRSVEKALAYEEERQRILWEEGTPVSYLSTRGGNEQEQKTYEQRIKEDANDYRYFPEPDLPPLEFKDRVIEAVRDQLPELPAAKRKRFQEQYGLSPADVAVLTDDKEVAHYTEQVISELKSWLMDLEEMEGTEEDIWRTHKKKLAKLVANWIGTELFKHLNEHKLSIKDCKITPENFSEFLTLIWKKKVNSSAAQTILETMLGTGADPSHILEEKDLGQMDDARALDVIIAKIITTNEKVVAEYRGGKENAIQFLVGMVMKESKGKANPETALEILRKKLS